MANDEHLALLRAGVDTWNAWRREHQNIAPNLSEADFAVADLGGAYLFLANFNKTTLRKANLREADLRKTDLSEANLREANLRGAELFQANLREADLSEANLSGANLREADLRGAELFQADLRGADLSGADLVRVNLTRANLSEANLSGTALSETRFAHVDLSTTKGLETCKHIGPSVLDDRTLQDSGPLPLGFLRGCGLPDRLIEYQLSSLGKAVQYHSCFISYSSRDGAFAKRLHERLQNHGVRCWFAPQDLSIGAKTWDKIDEAIRLRDKMLLILSEHALASDWIEDEVTKAFAEERRRGQIVLFPIRIDDAVMKTSEPWAVKLRDQRNIGDFRKWKDYDAYHQAFERVLRDLKTVPG